MKPDNKLWVTYDRKKEWKRHLDQCAAEEAADQIKALKEKVAVPRDRGDALWFLLSRLRWATNFKEMGYALGEDVCEGLSKYAPNREEPT